MGSFFDSVGFVDLFALVFLAFSFILGLIKGFTWQVIRIVTIVLGMILAKAFAPSFSSALQNMFSGLEESKYTIYIAYFVIFLGVFILGTLIAILMGNILKTLRLKAYDRLLGGVMGLLTGWFVIVLLILLALTLFQDGAFNDEIKSSQTARCSAWAIERAHPLIPQELQDEVGQAVRKAVIELKELEEDDTPPTEETEEDG